MDTRLKILFVCSRNQWRSPTAEKIYANCPNVIPRSRGTAKSARRRISENDIQWADLILVMENKHKANLVKNFQNAIHDKPIVVLDIPDEYQFMDPELADLIRESVDPLIEANSQSEICL
jgi:predicted protein tyrosine phosphatase